MGASAKLGWVQAGLTVFAFAAPSAVMAVPYLIGMAGFLGGLLICLVITASAVGGSMMLLQVKLQHPSCHTFGDLGMEVLGRPGRLWGNLIQIGNFCLFLPCAMHFCALALEGIGKGIASFNGCTDYYIFVVALVCLLTTQARQLSNTVVFTYVSVASVLSMSVCMVVAALAYDNSEKVPAELLGNPEGGSTIGLIKVSGGFTIATWAYVPCFLAVELVTCMEEPKEFRKSLLLSATLNVLMVVVVGFTVVHRWGYDVGEVISITEGVAAWTPGYPINTAFNAFQLVGNFVSYMLDSVPLGRFCQKMWAPEFTDTWSLADTLRYLGYTLPTFLFALLLAVFVPSVNVLLDFTTALTVPMVTTIYPAVLYWQLFCRSGRSPMPKDGLGLEGHSDEAQAEKQAGGTRRAVLDRLGPALVLAVGCVSFVMCLTKAVGYVALDELRPPLSIGCGGWTLWTTGA